MHHVPPLFVVVVAAVAAPVLAQFTMRYGLPGVVIELVFGVLIGPQVLGWAAPINAVPYFALLGMVFLFFLAGLEIDLIAIARELKLAAVGWLLAFALACAAALGMRALGLAQAWMVVAIAIVTVGLGVLVPILADKGQLRTPFGRYVIAVGAAGEIGPILVMAIALSTRRSAPMQAAFTAIFLVAVVAIGWALVWAKGPRLLGVLRRTMTQSSQLPIRICLLVMFGLAILAEVFGIDLALGALAAGMIAALVMRGVESHTLHHKLDAIGYGLLIPIFFVTSGMKLDVAALFRGTAGLTLAAAFIVAIVLTRIPVVALHRRILGARQSMSLGLFSATTLSLVVAITQIGVDNGLMTAAEAAPLVGAGALTVVLFPAFALKVLREPASQQQPVSGIEVS